MRLLRFVGHPTPRRQRDRLRLPRHSHVYTFRRLPREWPELWKLLLRGASRSALEQLSLRLLEHAGARARGAIVQADLRAVKRFFVEEATTLAEAIAATGYAGYPVPQRDRDALFLRYRYEQLPPHGRNQVVVSSELTGSSGSGGGASGGP
jgi:hypothetical protein